MKKKIALRKAVRFHGHLGPYLILGILAGELAIEKLKAKKYFGLEVKVYGASRKPKSCLIDGLQLSTGATYGKGNIRKFAGHLIKIEVYNRLKNKRITLTLKKGILERLKAAKTHKDSELLAKELYQTDAPGIFFKLGTPYAVLSTKNRY